MGCMFIKAKALNARKLITLTCKTKCRFDVLKCFKCPANWKADSMWFALGGFMFGDLASEL